MSYTLVIGNKAYSSWSLRGWLLLEAYGIPFEEQLIPLYTDAFLAAQAPDGALAPGRQVPTLIHQEGAERRVVWDSLAIAEYLAERHPEAGIWPSDPAARAAARCLAAEMHSGFSALRSNMPMNLKRSYPGRGRTPAVASDVERLEALWAWARAGFGGEGPFLFGAFSATDAFFTPVASRLRTYAVALSGPAQAYCDALLATPAFRAWEAAAVAEPWVEPRYQYED
ncbi:MAG: glutathione S-transferase family protein [Pseudomonadota bacterium]